MLEGKEKHNLNLRKHYYEDLLSITAKKARFKTLFNYKALNLFTFEISNS